jgi:hypothetical protein
MTVQLKDMRNALATAGEIGFDAPSPNSLQQLYADAWSTAWAGWTTAACSWNWPQRAAVKFLRFLHRLAAELEHNCGLRLQRIVKKWGS